MQGILRVPQHKVMRTFQTSSLQLELRTSRKMMKIANRSEPFKHVDRLKDKLWLEDRTKEGIYKVEHGSYPLVQIWMECSNHGQTQPKVRGV